MSYDFSYSLQVIVRAHCVVSKWQPPLRACTFWFSSCIGFCTKISHWSVCLNDLNVEGGSSQSPVRTKRYQLGKLPIVPPIACLHCIAFAARCWPQARTSDQSGNYLTAPQLQSPPTVAKTSLYCAVTKAWKATTFEAKELRTVNRPAKELKTKKL